MSDLRFAHLRQDIIGQLTILARDADDFPTKKRVAAFNILQYVVDMFVALGLSKDEFIQTIEDAWAVYEKASREDDSRVSPEDKGFVF